MFTPPAFRNFGIPPANSPPNCGAPLIVAELSLALSLPVSLLLLALFPGTGGASPPGGAGGLPMPGIGGAPPIGGALGLSDTFPTTGADRSLTTVTFFSFVPFAISPSSAPLPAPAFGLPPGGAPGIGGGGGGGGPPPPGKGGGIPLPLPIPGGIGGGGGGADMMTICERELGY